MTNAVDAATFAPLEGTDPALPGDPFARPRYSYGQLLGAEDFVTEQRYHLLRARLRNALLHGSGVVCGLDVIAKTIADPPSVELICTPGLAIDPLGREVFVPEAICLDVTGLANNESFWSDLSPPPDDPEGDTRRCYAVLSYHACLSAQTPAIAQPCSDADNSLVYSRVLDSYRLCLEAAPPPDPHALSRDWPALAAPTGLRARLQALLTDAPAHPEQLWSYPQDAKVLLAVVDLKPVGSPAETTDIAAVDTSVRALLPDVQTVASLATGLRLVGPAAAPSFALDSVSVAAGTGGDAGKTIVTATLTGDVQAGTLTADSVHLFKLDGGAWITPVVAAPVGAGPLVTLKVDEDWSGGGDVTYQLVLSGGGARPILDLANQPLAGLTDEPTPPSGRGRDAVVIGVFTP